ncbi:protein pelota [Tetranychus urticae]|uniref:Protein pelota homolog n=1 Tax=Tetranychus urticae TaxID=32264 RepID=T1KV36_TETUR|nr:protein pelota [Tetranychus urticae]
MKLVGKYIDKDNHGSVVLIPEEDEDMWHAYNLIEANDAVKASTFRKVTLESATGSTGSSRVRTTLTLKVESTEYDTQACLVRVKGRNIVENQFVKMNQYHTLDLELNRKFTLTKEHWDSIALDRLEMACDPTQRADLAAVVMQQGLANVCFITSSMTITRAKVECNIPRKRKGLCSQHEKGMNRFFESVMQAIIRHINFDVVKCVLLASPGFVKDQFYEFMVQEAVKQDNKLIIENKNKFVLVHSSSGFKHSLKEILVDPLIQNRLADTKAAAEVKALDSFYQMLSSESDRAFYGYKHVEKANQFQAIETLLISDHLFRCNDPLERKRYVALVDSVKENGGEVRIFSSLHISGEQLEQLTGIAAILRFPIPDMEDDDDSGEDESKSNEANCSKNLKENSNDKS